MRRAAQRANRSAPLLSSFAVSPICGLRASNAYFAEPWSIGARSAAMSAVGSGVAACSSVAAADGAALAAIGVPFIGAGLLLITSSTPSAATRKAMPPIQNNGGSWERDTAGATTAVNPVGRPQFGQAGATSETCRPQSGQVTKAIEVPPA